MTQVAGCASPGGGVIAICTKDRPNELAVACQTAHAASPDMPVVVVDASQSEATRSACEKLSRDGGSSKIHYVRADAPGLTRQRNQAIAICESMGCEFIHFIDDDTIVEKDYFSAIEARFRQDPTAMGVGGVITNQPTVGHVRLKRLFLLASKRRGAVLRSGRHTLGQYPGTPPEKPVDWLSGCSMSFRREAFAELRFDETLRGYSMGEDADFCFRLSRKHRIVVEPGAECLHTVTPTIRDRVSIRRRESTENTYRRVLRYRTFGLSSIAYWWATFGDVAIRSVYGLAARDRATLEEVQGILDGVKAILRGECRPVES